MPQFDLLLPHPTAPQLLVQETPDGWRLPALSIDIPESELAIVEPLIERVHQRFHSDISVMRRVKVYTATDATGDPQMVVIFALENHGADATPPAAMRWAGAAELTTLAEPHQQAAAAQWFAEVEGSALPTGRVDWARPGWFGRVSAWIRAQLAAIGATVTGPMVQLKHWGISAVVRVPTNQGPVFFKALPPLFAIEPVLTAALSRWYPDDVPSVIAIAPNERWMLQRAFRGEALNECLPPAWHRSVEIFARMQIGCVARVPDLFALGVPDRRLDVLKAQIEPFLAQPELSEWGEMEAEELTRLRALVPHLHDLCDRVAACGIPDTLAHGDFHSYNIVVEGDDCIIYDWTDASVSHPFFDLHTLFLSSFPDALQPERERIRDTYLSAWTRIAPLPALIEVFEMTKPLNNFHQAISYYHILAQMEPDARAELRWGLTYFLGMVGEGMEK